MGKWTNLKGTVQKFEQEPSYQQEIDEHKQALVGHTKLQLCEELYDEDLAKKRLEAELHTCNARREALSQLLLERLEADGDSKFVNAFGTFYVADDPYSKVVDKLSYLAWVREQGLEALLTVPYQSTNVQVKERLEAGEPLPPGVEVYIKSAVRRRSA